MATRTLIMSSRRVRRTLSRLACEVVERNRGADNLVVIGIQQAGVEVARRIGEEISGLCGSTVPIEGLNVVAYRDDRPGPEKPDSAGAPAPVEARAIDLADRDVILVDDVLYTGRTARAALDAIVQHGRPRSIQFAVLVDRGHREYPIQADYTGRLIQTKSEERIVVDADHDLAIFSEE